METISSGITLMSTKVWKVRIVGFGKVARERDNTKSNGASVRVRRPIFAIQIFS